MRSPRENAQPRGSIYHYIRRSVNAISKRVFREAYETLIAKVNGETADLEY